ncbi:hypothetical protein [Terasakiella pusilla]|uniref:hypothetical protein n=1 Tax=Terasakiella pusilla TaxID=64973 RepID=UPI003AA93FE2
MGWNGSGVFTRTNGTNTGSSLWENDRDAGIKITAENHDNQDQDLADGIQACLAKNGENFPTADLPMNSQKHTGVGNATAANHYAAAGQVQNSAFVWGGTAAGTADALTINLTPTLTAYTAGLTVRFLASDDSATTTPTININAAGAKTLVNQDGDALTAGDITNGTIYEAVYDGTNFRIYVAASQDLSDYVTGPASATDGVVALFDGTGGKTLKDGVAIASGSGSLLRTDGDASGLTGIIDQVARDTAVVAIIQSDVAGGVYGPIVSYDFSTDSLATSTNATNNSGTESYSNSGSPVQIAQGTGTAIGDLVNGGGLAAAYDGNTSQDTTTCAYKSSSTSGYNNTVGKNWGSGKSVVKAIFYGVSDAAILSSNATTIKVQGYNGSSWVDVSSAKNTTTNNGETITFETADFTDTTSYNQHRFNVNGNGVNAIGCSEAEFFEPDTPGNMTLIPDAVTLGTADPTDVSLYVNVTEVAGADASTNIECRFTIDGGSTYTTAAVADVEYTFGADVLLRFDGDVSAQTGSSFKWEITTLNNDGFVIFEPRCVPLY